VAFLDNNAGLNVNTAANFSQTNVGWAIGAGAEWKLTHNWSVRGEYLYVDLGSINGSTPRLTSLLAGSPAPTNYLVSAHMTENIGRLALSYKFGGY
jgi:outer membrane immunogenic protein